MVNWYPHIVGKNGESCTKCTNFDKKTGTFQSKCRKCEFHPFGYLGKGKNLFKKREKEINEEDFLNESYGKIRCPKCNSRTVVIRKKFPNTPFRRCRKCKYEFTKDEVNNKVKNND